MRKFLLTTGAAAMVAASVAACSSMDSGSSSGQTSASPAATGTNSSAKTPDAPSQSAPSPQDTPK